MIRKLFSDKFLKKAEGLGLTIPQLLGFKRTTLVFYPFITGKGLQNIKNVFRQTPEEDIELMDYYSRFIQKNMRLMQKAIAIADAVNSRMTYKNDEANYKKAEYWARPIDTHKLGYDDCDGYACLICYILRLFGAKDYEVFVAAGWVEYSNGTRIGHAYVLVLDTNSMQFFPLEGSFYPRESKKKFGIDPLQNQKRYKSVWWISNDKVSYSRLPWLRFVR